ncbi:MAG TPA: ATP-binding protein [Thermoanaerobaculia bacterium]|nr:ATP-binding protein [Thermoanaerobaculia bacterium]
MRRVRPFFSSILFRLLAFNLLLVFLPVAGILYLDIYEEHLEAVQRRAMVNEGEILAAILAGQNLSDGRLAELLEALDERAGARLRVLGPEGRVLADSGQPPVPVTGHEAAEIRENWLYRLGRFLLQRPLRLIRPADPIVRTDFYEDSARLLGEEVLAAMRGEVGEAKRIISADPPAVMLYTGVPILDEGRVRGVVLVSESTYAILRDLYTVRLGIFRIFLVSLAAALILSLWVGMTIVRPIRRLRIQAGAILDPRGRLRRGFLGSNKRDEIGELSRALEALTNRLDTHQQFIESFTSDVSHEFKNPLASIRNATEMLSQVDDPGERQRFLRIAEREIARMEHLLSSLRDVTKIDARLASEPRSVIDIRTILEPIIEGFRLRERERVRFQLDLPDHPVRASVSEERMIQIFENVLDNAVGFSPPGGTILIRVVLAEEQALITVRDQGPGIPPEHLALIFRRFFTWRPDEEGRIRHTGLGLAIVKAIVEGYGGTAIARNAPEGGAEIEIRLPRA